jgi:hypothetical protein
VGTSSSSTGTTSSAASSSSTGGSTGGTGGSTGAITVAGPLGLNWIAPTKRQDGTVLDINEIGGYELRYRAADKTNFTYISIIDAWTTQYNFAWLEGSYVFQVAAFDKNGVYSEFVNIAN